MSAKANIELLRGTRDSARLYKWDMQIQNASLDTEYINIRAESTDQPQPTNLIIDVNIRGFTRKEAGAIDWAPLTFAVVETDDYAALKQFTELQNRQFNYRTGVQEAKATVETTVLLFLQGIDDSVNATWSIFGGVFESAPPPQLSNAKDGYWTGWTWTLHFDYALLG